MAVAEELELKVLADTKQAENKITGLANHVDKKSKSMGEKMGAAGKKMTLGVTLPIVGALGASVKAFTAQEDATKKLNSAFESTGAASWTSQEALMANADALQQITTHGDEAIEEMQSVLLTFTQIKGENFDGATKSILDMSDALGMDLQSSATMVGKALNDPVAGIAAMSRAGITFSDEQKETIKRLVEMGDTAGAQAVMLGELETQFGGTAEAMAETSSGQMKQAMNNLGDSMETIGAIVIPILSKVAEWAATLSTKFQNLSPNVQKFITIAVGVVAAIGPILMIGAKLVKMFQMASAAVTFLGQSALRAQIMAFGPWIIAVGAVIAIGYLLYKNWDTISAFLLSIFNTIKDFVVDVWGAIAGFFSDTWDSITETFWSALDAIKAFWSDVWEGIKVVVEAVWDGIVWYVETYINTVKTIIETVINTVKATWDTVWNAIKTTAETVWNAIDSTVDTAINNVKNNIQTIIDTITGLWDTFTEGLSSAWDTVWDTMGDGLEAAISGVVGILTGALNGILGALETNINSVIALLNAAIEGYNKIPLAPDIPTIPTVSVPRLAEGGMVGNSGPVRVGERGMEIVNLPKGASVTPNSVGHGGALIGVVNTYSAGTPQEMAQAIGWELLKKGGGN